MQANALPADRSRETTLAKFSFRTAKRVSGPARVRRTAKALEAEVDRTGARGRPLRLRFQISGEEPEWTVEMSERDAVAFSEWLDEVVTEIEMRRQS